MDSDQILPHVFVGSCPTTPTDIDCLKSDFGITAVLNLQTQEDFIYREIRWEEMEVAYRKLNVELRWVPVLDFNPSELRRRLSDCVQALDDLLRAGHTVYVHCNAGMNRSPSTVVAHLHWVQGMGLDEAVDFVTQRRSCEPYANVIRLATEDREKGSG